MSVEKSRRNENIFAHSIPGGGKMSFGQLAKKYNVNKKTIFAIVKRIQVRLKKSK